MIGGIVVFVLGGHLFSDVGVGGIFIVRQKEGGRKKGGKAELKERGGQKRRNLKTDTRI